MLSFSQFLLNEFSFRANAADQNKHLTHIEDLVIEGGVNGTREAITTLLSMRYALAGTGTQRNKMTTKFDGAPAIFCGINPSNGKFFVATKGLFNKDPKINYTDADILKNHSGDLAEKLKVALKYFPLLGITDVIQGDIMFTSKDLKEEDIDGEKYLTFHPNTIIYAVKADSDIANEIRHAKIGVVFHTSYKGNDLQSMKAEFGVNLSKLNKNSNIWIGSSEIKDLSGIATMTAEETATVDRMLKKCGYLFKDIGSSILQKIHIDNEIYSFIATYNNQTVRKGAPITDFKNYVNGLMTYVSNKLNDEIENKKALKTKETWRLKKLRLMMFFSSKNKRGLEKMFELQSILASIKEIFINKLNTLNSLNTFIKTKDGYKVTSGEGFVVVDHLGNGAVKLVDRLEFSRNNFSNDVIKGWER